MTSRLKIVNTALGHLGEERTETLEDALIRPAVRKVLPFLDDARDAVLSSHPWYDALDYQTLYPSGEPGDWRFADVYLTPAGTLRIADVNGSHHWQRGTRVNGEGVEQRVIKANAGGAALKVTLVRRIDWNVIPVHLDVTLGLQLAALACFGVNADATRQQALQRAADSARLIAMGADAVQGGGAPTPFGDPFGEIRARAY